MCVQLNDPHVAQVHDSKRGTLYQQGVWSFYMRADSRVLIMSQLMFNHVALALSKRFIDLLRTVALWQAKRPGQLGTKASPPQAAADVLGNASNAAPPRSAADALGSGIGAAGPSDSKAEPPAPAQRPQQAAPHISVPTAGSVPAIQTLPLKPAHASMHVQQPAQPQLPLQPVPAKAPLSAVQPHQAQQAAQAPRKSGGQQDVRGMLHKAAAGHKSASAARLHSSGIGAALASMEAGGDAFAQRGADRENVPAVPASPIDLCAASAGDDSDEAPLISELAAGHSGLADLVPMGPAVLSSPSGAQQAGFQTGGMPGTNGSPQRGGRISDESGSDGSASNAGSPVVDTVMKV